jgi:crotonobetainyl-CoA:carnitine CoA-transferase CaiB-like acyl-CoA transferase
MAAPVKGGPLGDTKVVGSPLNFSGIKKEILRPTPEAGEHNHEVLHWLGYAQQEIDRLRGLGVI